MKTTTTASIVLILILIIQQSNSENLFNLIDKFIKSSNAAAISFISIERSVANGSVLIEQFQSIPKMIFTFDNLNNCSDFANIDFYDDAIAMRKFSKHRRRENLSLPEVLVQMEYNDFVISAPWNFVDAILKCFVHPLSRYLIIITASSPSLTKLTIMLNTTWTNNGAFNVFIVAASPSQTYDKVFKFNPFHRNDDGSFGKLNHLVAMPFESAELKNLNGYPLRVELFASTYTLARSKQTKSVDEFYGPDADVAKMTRELLNATSKSVVCVCSCDDDMNDMDLVLFNGV